MPPKPASAKPAAAAAASAPAEPAPIDPGPEIDLRKEKVKAAFRIFDAENTGAVLAEEIPTILRYLRLYATDKDFVEQVLPDLEGDEASPYIQYPKFEKKVLELMDINAFEPDSEDGLLSAFRALDPANNGYIPLEKFKDTMTSTGAAPMKESEFSAFLSVLPRSKKVDEDGKEFEVVMYEGYVAMVGR